MVRHSIGFGRQTQVFHPRKGCDCWAISLASSSSSFSGEWLAILCLKGCAKMKTTSLSGFGSVLLDMPKGQCWGPSPKASPLAWSPASNTKFCKEKNPQAHFSRGCGGIRSTRAFFLTSVGSAVETLSCQQPPGACWTIPCWFFISCGPSFQGLSDQGLKTGLRLGLLALEIPSPSSSNSKS